MESIALSIDPTAFDRCLRATNPPSLKDAGDLAIYIKPKATTSLAPAAMLTFTVQLPDGTMARAQTVTTVECLKSALMMIQAFEAAGRFNPADGN